MAELVRESKSLSGSEMADQILHFILTDLEARRIRALLVPPTPVTPGTNHFILGTSISLSIKGKVNIAQGCSSD